MQNTTRVEEGVNRATDGWNERVPSKSRKCQAILSHEIYTVWLIEVLVGGGRPAYEREVWPTIRFRNRNNPVDLDFPFH